MDGLRRVFRANLTDDVVRIEHLSHSLFAADPVHGAAAARDLLAIAHRLSGTAGSLGFDDIGALAGAADTALAGGGEMSGRDPLHPLLDDLLKACREQVLASPKGV
jgi:hypothetical protein